MVPKMFFFNLPCFLGRHYRRWWDGQWLRSMVSISFMALACHCCGLKMGHLKFCRCRMIIIDHHRTSSFSHWSDVISQVLEPHPPISGQPNNKDSLESVARRLHGTTPFHRWQPAAKSFAKIIYIYIHTVHRYNMVYIYMYTIYNILII